MNQPSIQHPPNLPVIPPKKVNRSDALTIFLLIIFLVMLIIGSDLAALLGSGHRTHQIPFDADPRPAIEILIPNN